MTIDTSAWKTYKFGDIAQNMTTAIKDPLLEGFERYVGLEHIVPGNIHIKSWGKISDGTTFTRVFRKGQVLFGKRRAYQKKAAIAEFDGVCSGDILVFKANEEYLISELLPFITQSDKFFNYAAKTSAGSLSPRTKFKDLSKLKFKLPPLEEQKGLADLLWSVDEVIEKYNIVFSTLDCLCKIYAFQEFSGNNNKFIFLKETIKLFKGKQPNKLYSDSKEGRLPYLTTDYIRNGISRFVDVSSVDENNLTDYSDILLLWDGSNAGETFLGYRGIVASTMAKIKIVANEVLQEYLYFYLRLNENVIKRARIGSAIPHVSADFLLHLKFPVKKLNDQQKFVNKINDFENQKNMVNSNNIILRKVKKQIINQIFGRKP